MKKITLFILVALFSIASNATTYYVRSATGADTNDGLTEGTAFQTLDKVFSLTLANGDIVDISGTFDYYVSKTLTKSITIQGTNKSTAIIQGLAGSMKRCFGIGDASNLPTVTIENVTFQNFDYFDDATSTIGGVINITAGSSLICRNVNFLNNQAYSGGAIANAGSATFEDCYFYGNKTMRRTGGTNADGAAINVSASAGDISLIIKRCLFEANSTQNTASAVRFKSTSTAGTVNLLIENSTFFGNMVASPSTSTTSGCILLDVSTSGASVSLINNTIAYNTSVVASGRAGISIAGVANMVKLYNNILYSNTNGSSGNISISASYAMKESRNNITNQAYDFAANTTASMSFDNVSSVTEAQLALATTLADNGGATKTLAINASSVATNAGYAAVAPAVDQRGVTRMGVPDVGAYENTTTTTGKQLSVNTISCAQSTDKTVFSNIKDFNQVKVYSVAGQLIKSETISGDSYDLVLPANLYIVHFEGAKSYEVIKLQAK